MVTQLLIVSALVVIWYFFLRQTVSKIDQSHQTRNDYLAVASEFGFESVPLGITSPNTSFILTARELPIVRKAYRFKQSLAWPLTDAYEKKISGGTIYFCICNVQSFWQNVVRSQTILMLDVASCKETPGEARESFHERRVRELRNVFEDKNNSQSPMIEAAKNVIAIYSPGVVWDKTELISYLLRVNNSLS